MDALLKYGKESNHQNSLQIALSGYNPEDSANEEGLVRGYGLPFNIEPPEENKARKPHPIVGQKTGLHLPPDGPHETNHGPNCRAMFDGLKTCDELAGVNLNPFEQNHSKKKKFLRSLNVMGCDTFALMVTPVNELENGYINRQSIDCLVEKPIRHPKLHEDSCKVYMWSCGQCFCSTPLMRYFDRFGRVAVLFLA